LICPVYYPQKVRNSFSKSAAESGGGSGSVLTKVRLQEKKGWNHGMRIHKDVLGVMACMAFMGAIGSFFFICAVAGVDVKALGIEASMGFVCGFYGMFFSLMLLLNGFRNK
jgi:hypothetical protein